jgi:hypothetical protein
VHAKPQHPILPPRPPLKPCNATPDLGLEPLQDVPRVLDALGCFQVLQHQLLVRVGQAAATGFSPVRQDFADLQDVGVVFGVVVVVVEVVHQRERHLALVQVLAEALLLRVLVGAEVLVVVADLEVDSDLADEVVDR